QARTVLDRHEVLRLDLDVARYIVGIAADILDELGLAGSSAAPRGTDRHRPWWIAGRLESDRARPHFLHERGAFLVEQDDARDRDGQTTGHAIDDALQDIFERFPLQRLARNLGEDFGKHCTPARQVAPAPRG